MSRQQLQDSEAVTSSPDKGVLATVLNYLKAKNLKVTEEALKRELGMQDESSASLAHSGTEPEKYEESYSSTPHLTPSSSAPLHQHTAPPPTIADLQLAASHSPLSPRSTTAHNSDTHSDMESDDSEEEEENDEDSIIEDDSSDDTPVAVSFHHRPATGGARSHSWPGSSAQEDIEERDEVQSPSSTTSHGDTSGCLSSDKSPLWVRNVFRSSTSSEGLVSPLQKQPLVLQGATSTPTQLPMGGPFFYQLAPAPGTSLGATRQQVIAPIFTVVPANASLVNPTLARAMTLPTSGQPLVLNGAPQGLSLSNISQQQQVLARKESESPSSLSSLPHSTEPTTGQTVTSPLLEQVTMNHSLAGRTSPTRTLASIPLSELTPQYSELKAFAEEFKSKRIRLGFTQGAVGQSLADKGYSNFAQSTISRFEQMQLSPTNAAAIKQVLEKWLQEAENPEAAHSASSTTNLPFMASRKRKKRAVFTPQTRTSLDSFFKQNPRPNRQLIESIANQLELLPEEVRVWFCNKRQKHKQNQTTYHFDQDLGLSASSGASSPTSLYESSVGIKRNTPSPKTPFTIEELSKSSTVSSSAATATQLTSPFMSPTSLVMAVTTPRVFLNPLTSAPVTTTAMTKFIPSPPWSISQTTA